MDDCRESLAAIGDELPGVAEPVGGTREWTAGQTLAAAVNAVRAGDLAALSGLVDWTLSGAVVFRGLADDFDAEDRSAVGGQRPE